MTQHKEPRYKGLFEYIDNLPADKEFTYLELEKASGLTNLHKSILPLVRAGLLARVEKPTLFKFFRKSEKWSLTEAMELNYLRLKAKGEKYNPRQKQKRLEMLKKAQHDEL